MNIVLNQKDADFILKYLRSDLEKLILAEKEHDSKYEILKQHYEKMEKDSAVDDLMEVASKLHDGVNKGMSDFHKGLEHCIELLMCGSEVLNENS